MQATSFISGYQKPDVMRMGQLLVHVVNGLEAGFCDFLGKIFMQLELGDKYRAQFFTPRDLARMMAMLLLGDMDRLFQARPFITLSESACGAGCMVLAVADVLNQAGYVSHRQLLVSVTDVGPLAAGIAYIQLSLCGVAGEVVIGNSLHNERRRVLYTPGHYLGNWPFRLKHALVHE